MAWLSSFLRRFQGHETAGREGPGTREQERRVHGHKGPQPSRPPRTWREELISAEALTAERAIHVLGDGSPIA